MAKDFGMWNEGKGNTHHRLVVVQFIKFCIVGVSNTLISYLLNIVVLLLLRNLELSWDFIVGNIVSFTLSVLWAFYWNNRFVFHMKEGKSRYLWRSLFRTYIAYGFTGLILCNICSWLWIDWFEISKYVAPVFNLLISVPINFCINKWWAFKDNGE